LNEQKNPQENCDDYCQIRVILKDAITYGSEPCYFRPSDSELCLNCLRQQIPRCASPRRDIARSVRTRKPHCAGKDERDSGGTDELVVLEASGLSRRRRWREARRLGGWNYLSRGESNLFSIYTVGVNTCLASYF
jgi:hypothetical protein